MNHNIIQEGDFKYLEIGNGDQVIMLLHGLFGALSNFEGIIEKFSTTHKIVVPMLPIFELPIRKASVSGLVDFVDRFVDFKGYTDIHILGNSLGGHITILYALLRQEKIKSVTLTGSSGLFENSLGSTFPKRSNFEFIKNKTLDTFYNQAVASDELINEVFSTVNDRNKVIRIIATAKSAIRHNLGDKLHQLKVPTLLVWGKNDNVTPLFVGERFHELIKNSRLEIIDECGHAPMMEKPVEFNNFLENFYQTVESSTKVS